jgi:hypothetical protein
MIRWLGHDILQQHPAIRMLHETRAAETARQKVVPLEERPSYKIRQARIFARGRNGANDNEIAKSPQEKAAEEAAALAAAAPGVTEPVAGVAATTDEAAS